jgi:dihydrofolate synthase/folylpolyglutamate synthase
MSFLKFAEEKVDYAVIETGIGGRLDSTNVIKPQICGITSIGLDHCDSLGETIELIAKEKAGIIKEGVATIVGPIAP